MYPRLLALLVFGIGLLAHTYPSYSQSNTPKAKHVILIGLDAFSSRGLQKAATPAMDKMIKGGALAPYARCVLPTVSTPNWTSMLTGVDPVQHGIYDNSWERDSPHWDPIRTGPENVYPSLLSWMREQRPESRIHFFYEWSGLSRMFEMSVVDKHFRSKSGTEVFDTAVDHFFAERPDFLFLGIDETDAAGHEHGHDTHGYYNMISYYDQKIGAFIDRLEKEGLMDEAVILITGDHGGINFGHGGRTLYELEIPILLYGKGVTAGKVLEEPYYIYDVAPTLAYFLGVTPPAGTIGRVMAEAMTPVTGKKAFVAIPHIEPKGGFINAAEVSVNLLLRQSNGSLYYTLDGSDPDSNSTPYQAPIQLKHNAALKVVNIVNGQKSRIEATEYRLATGNTKVSWKYYEGTFTALPALDTMTPIKSGKSHEISLDEISHREDQFALVFTATLNLPQDGEYLFYANSDDGSFLFINGEKLIDNDGSHGLTEVSGKIALSAGSHQLEVWYFDDFGGQDLNVSIQGPGIPKQILTEKYLK
ncbi:alkaline phosphatase family protein [Lunatimonas salinarum]|uniref:alkaline phosphatase family protein n=1 Tax=Lunatimonas salinarum TaxID=1774590 RepID=UPI001AE081CD|nr:alkaline phosphatase family protein [Lunatimonas salinarum]